MQRSSADAGRLRRLQRSCASCADRRRVTSRARRCTPTVECLWVKSQTRNPKLQVFRSLNLDFGLWDLLRPQLVALRRLGAKQVTNEVVPPPPHHVRLRRVAVAAVRQQQQVEVLV